MKCGPQNDRCFVHLNSTVMSHGYYMIHRALGKKMTQDLVFRALTQYYRENTNLHEAANLVRQACKDLYDPGVCDKVDGALRQVEL
jgi:Zn-dependent metalloprotease